jgi:hypothetical protein
MPGHHSAPAEFVLRRIVESFGNHLFQLEELHLTHIYRVVFCFCKDKNIGYLVLRYLNTGALPFEEFSEDWLIDSEE